MRCCWTAVCGQTALPCGKRCVRLRRCVPQGCWRCGRMAPAGGGLRVPAESGGVRIAALLSVLAKKPLPYLAAAHRAQIERAAERFLDALGMRREWKGRSYAAWCPVPPGPRPRAGSAARQPAVRGMRQSLRGQRRSGGALPSRRRGGRVHHGQYPQHRALLRRDHRPGQGQAHQPGLSDGSRRAASLTP